MRIETQPNGLRRRMIADPKSGQMIKDDLISPPSLRNKAINRRKYVS